MLRLFKISDFREQVHPGLVGRSFPVPRPPAPAPVPLDWSVSERASEGVAVVAVVSVSRTNKRDHKPRASASE